MFDMKNNIHCSVVSCAYNESRSCNAQQVEVTLNNAIVANKAAETACKTFKPKAF